MPMPFNAHLARETAYCSPLLAGLQVC